MQEEMYNLREMHYFTVAASCQSAFSSQANNHAAAAEHLRTTSFSPSSSARLCGGA